MIISFFIIYLCYFRRIRNMTFCSCKNNIPLLKHFFLFFLFFLERDIEVFIESFCLILNDYSLSNFAEDYQLLRYLINLYQIFCAKKKMIGKTGKKLNMDDIKERLAFFLMNYEDPQMTVSQDESYARLGKLKYRIALQQIANRISNRLEIHIEDIEDMLRK